MTGQGDTPIIAPDRPRKCRQAHAALSFAAALLSLTVPVSADKRGNRMLGPRKMRATGRDRMRRGKRVRAAGRLSFTPLSLTALVRAGKTSGVA
ncbi:hypothetical protein [uncultured Paracoccus sp.]|uniref:hypothetical protein n=1 Tax=uncultured Paracoccus sp. TaxID=189685 RepID=UPI0025DDC463|nr:hypothetical protein [uncultured Paracoccus sp.]